MRIPLRTTSSRSGSITSPPTYVPSSSSTERGQRRLTWFARGGMLAVCIACVGAVLVCLGDRGRQFTETGPDAPPVVRLVQPKEPTKEDLAEDTEATGRRAIDFSLPSVTHDGV